VQRNRGLPDQKVSMIHGPIYARFAKTNVLGIPFGRRFSIAQLST
jgi:hypothetical protein